ncbi:MAG TPA: recombination protein O N-terminal domain-containing protein [Candidatus Paceibacterota bacterium]|nr:recombination protein O N-terminal domain-containing protein [Candidatus Paceibacterota bacterium]
MRHKYRTRGIILARAPAGEANASLTILTEELGLIRARAQGLRRPGAKLAAALTTFAEADLQLVRGKDSWRVAGALSLENWFEKLPSRAARERAARVTGLLLRLAGEAGDEALYATLAGFLSALSVRPEAEHDPIEIMAALELLRTLGLDAGEAPADAFSPEALARASRERASYVARINRGITASGL